MSGSRLGAYGADSGLVDYILGITFEIWEERGLEKIHEYYSQETVVFGLDGIVHGTKQMVEGTRSMLEAFPDRLLLAADVIWSGDRADGYYSSHRIISPMTNEGATIFGPATGRKVHILTVADCVVEQGVITREWLLRDNHALVVQLGHDPIDAARIVAGRRNDESRQWLRDEIARVSGAGVPQAAAELPDPADSIQAFAEQVIANDWAHGEPQCTAAAYAPYAVAHRSPIELHSGREAIAAHYTGLRGAIDVSGVSVDHICVQPADSRGLHVAVRWAVAGTHGGDYLGLAASGRDVFVMGSTHWRIDNNRIAIEWTVFDSLAVLSQMVDG